MSINLQINILFILVGFLFDCITSNIYMNYLNKTHLQFIIQTCKQEKSELSNKQVKSILAIVATNQLCLFQQIDQIQIQKSISQKGRAVEKLQKEQIKEIQEESPAPLDRSSKYANHMKQFRQTSRYQLKNEDMYQKKQITYKQQNQQKESNHRQQDKLENTQLLHRIQKLEQKIVSFGKKDCKISQIDQRLQSFDNKLKEVSKKIGNFEDKISNLQQNQLNLIEKIRLKNEQFSKVLKIDIAETTMKQLERQVSKVVKKCISSSEEMSNMLELCQKKISQDMTLKAQKNELKIWRIQEKIKSLQQIQKQEIQVLNKKIDKFSASNKKQQNLFLNDKHKHTSNTQPLNAFDPIKLFFHPYKTKQASFGRKQEIVYKEDNKPQYRDNNFKEVVCLEDDSDDDQSGEVQTKHGGRKNHNSEKAELWIDNDCYYQPFINLKGSLISSKRIAYVFGKCNVGQSWKFKIKFTKKDPLIGVGAADQSYKNEKNLDEMPNQIEYRTDGSIYKSGKIILNIMALRTFKKGQQIEVQLNIKECGIVWRNGHTDLHIEKWSFTQFTKVRWVPFIHFYHSDSVRLIK